MVEVISEHSSIHVGLERLIKEQCGYQLEIVQQEKYKVESDGVLRNMEIRVECPSPTQDAPPLVTISFTTPKTRADGSSLQCEIDNYIVEFSNLTSDGLSARIKACDTDNLCSEYSDRAYIQENTP